MFYVYGLIDPRDNEIHYVGITRNTPARRLASHIVSGASAKNSWLASVLDAGFLPTITVLQTAETYQEVFEMESWWIKLAETVGWPITNTNKTSRRFVRDIHDYITSQQRVAMQQAQNDLLNSIGSAELRDKPEVVVKPRPPRTKRRGRRFVADTKL